jgi:xanthine dehydrogenase accessory factor
MPLKTMIFGGGDLASGVALRLFRSGCKVVITELPKPFAVRRSVSFAQAVYDGQIAIENIVGKAVISFDEVSENLLNQLIPVIIDPEAATVRRFQPDIIIDARMTKITNPGSFYPEIFTVGLGPGFVVGENCDAVVETQRGHSMGRVYYSGSAEADTGIPDRVANFQQERVLRSPADGIFITSSGIGQIFNENDEIARVGSEIIHAPFHGMLRGLLHDGLPVSKGVKVGDIDPRINPRLCELVSDKSLAVGGGVLEVILSRPKFRQQIA